MRRIYENEIQDAARHLADLIICNDEKNSPQDRIVHTATAVIQDGMTIVVNGTAHKIKPLFDELLRRRPELRQVMEAAVEDYGVIATAKLESKEYGTERKKQAPDKKARRTGGIALLLLDGSSKAAL